MADRKPNRVRIDAIINAIKRGEYDDRLTDFQTAIQARLNFKRDEVLALVKEVYGENFQILPTSPSRVAGHPIVSSGGGGATEEETIKDALGDDPTPSGPAESGEPAYESRSPIIGPVNPS